MMLVWANTGVGKSMDFGILKPQFKSKLYYELVYRINPIFPRSGYTSEKRGQ